MSTAMASCVLEVSEPLKIWETSQSDAEPCVMDCTGVPEPVASV